MQSTLDFGHEDLNGQGARLGATWPPQVHSLLPDWQPIWRDFAASAQGQSVMDRMAQRLAAGARIYPPDPLRIFRTLALHEIRVVILGQDPYHGPGQAEGLAFSVPEGIPIPPSLRNIFKEIQRESLAPLRTSGHLGAWVRQGVLLLNTVLTVEEGQPASHADWGWQAFTDRVITAVAQRAQPTVFLLWGAHAQAQHQGIAAADLQARHLVLQANHPSPLSAMRGPSPFIGCGHFSATNDFLQKSAQTPIRW
mgnify:CR=1 FL=1